MGNTHIHTTFNRLQARIEKDAEMHPDRMADLKAIAYQVDGIHHDYAILRPEAEGSLPTIIDGDDTPEFLESVGYDALTLLHLMDMDGGPLVRKVTLTYDPDACTISIHRED